MVISLLNKPLHQCQDTEDGLDESRVCEAVPPASGPSCTALQLHMEFEAELERFTAYGFGPASQRLFLHAPHPKLAGRTPLEALDVAGGAEEAFQALRHSLATLESRL